MIASVLKWRGAILFARAKPGERCIGITKSSNKEY